MFTEIIVNNREQYYLFSDRVEKIVFSFFNLGFTEQCG